MNMIFISKTSLMVVKHILSVLDAMDNVVIDDNSLKQFNLGFAAKFPRFPAILSI
jgi:hypothetical protein